MSPGIRAGAPVADIDETGPRRHPSPAPRGRDSRRRRGAEPGHRAGRRRPHRAGAEPAQSPRRLRLPWLRLAGPAGSPAAGGVLRERRQGRRRGEHAADRRARLLRRPPRVGVVAALRVLAGQPGPADRTDGHPRRIGQLPTDHLGRRLHADRGAPAGHHPGPGGVLHVGPDLERGRVSVPVDGQVLRHEQPAGLLEHVPRVVGHRAAADHRHRQGIGVAGGHPPRRPDPGGRPEPGDEPSANAQRADRGQGARRAHRGRQSAAGGRALQVSRSADRERAGRRRHRTRRRLPADQAGRRPGPVPGAGPPADRRRGRHTRVRGRQGLRGDQHRGV